MHLIRPERCYGRPCSATSPFSRSAKYREKRPNQFGKGAIVSIAEANAKNDLSDQGVTPETIKLGITYPNVAA